MNTLQDVQKSIRNQLEHDYPDMDENTRLYMCVAGLAEESGEVAGILKRVFRGFDRDESRTGISNWVLELGDVLWYLVAVCTCLDVPLEYVWEQNCKKLEERYGRSC